MATEYFSHVEKKDRQQTLDIQSQIKCYIEVCTRNGVSNLE